MMKEVKKLLTPDGIIKNGDAYDQTKFAINTPFSPPGGLVSVTDSEIHSIVDVSIFDRFC